MNPAMNKESNNMENNNVTQEMKDLNNKIKDQVFELEKDNYLKKTLSPTEMVAKIKKIVEEAVK